MKWLSLILLFQSLVSLPLASSDELCRRANGALVARSACKKKEARVALEQFGAVGPKGEKGEKGDKGDRGEPGAAGLPGPPASADDLVLRDAHNDVVGVVEGLESYITTSATIIGSVNGQRFRFRVNKDGFEASELPLPAFLATLYESGDCSGPALLLAGFDPAFVSPSAGGSVPIDLAVSTQGIGYYAKEVAPRSIGSYKGSVGIPNDVCTSGSAVPIPGRASEVWCCLSVAISPRFPDGAQPLAGEIASVDLAQALTPPFRIDLP